jgi:DNA replication and repair protein RecF
VEVRGLRLTDLRNYERAEVAFDEGLNLVVGANGRGKTNLLEAIYVASSSASYRPGGNRSLIRWGCERAFMNLDAAVSARSVRIDVEVSSTGAIRTLINRAAPHGSLLESALAVVLFSPDDLAIVQGPPEGRRRFLDHAAARIRPRALATRREFERVLRQRNGLLKAAQSNPKALSSLDTWDEQFIEKGSALVEVRLQTLEKLRPQASKYQAAVSGGASEVGMAYAASWADRLDDPHSELASALEASRSSDLDRGVSLVGPHRDDVEITLAGSDARIYSSQGEQRTIALALRLAEHDVVKDERGQEPVLLLDDVFSELDDSRRGHLAEAVAGTGQAIVTATSAEGLPLDPAKVLRLEGGGVLHDG